MDGDSCELCGIFSGAPCEGFCERCDRECCKTCLGPCDCGGVLECKDCRKDCREGKRQ